MNLILTEQSPYKVTLPVFEGPLDLLLHLIREHEIDIYDIPIAKVCEQYLAYLYIMESLDLEVAGEWLVMAATLLEIKSRMLLPEDPKTSEDSEEEQIDPRLELVERLIEYEKFKGAAEIFKEREQQRAMVFVRGAAELAFDLKPTFDLEDITAVDLLAVLQQILSDVGEEEVTSIQRRKVTVRMRMREIHRKLTDAAGPVKFEELFDEDVNRIEVVITFLALLELLKSRSVKVRQKKAFASIEIVPIMEPNGK
ncbi:MAG: segregation/condensation protein A [Armatimonadota bacterium]|nr:segregation/condensation protein A [bacterium]